MHKANRRSNPKGYATKNPDDKNVGGDQVLSSRSTGRNRVIKYEGNTTTRRYSNTMQEAFPKDPSNAQWFYPPVRVWRSRDVLIAGVGILLWIWLTYFFVRD